MLGLSSRAVRYLSVSNVSCRASLSSMRVFSCVSFEALVVRLAYRKLFLCHSKGFLVLSTRCTQGRSPRPMPESDRPFEMLHTRLAGSSASLTLYLMHDVGCLDTADVYDTATVRYGIPSCAHDQRPIQRNTGAGQCESDNEPGIETGLR